MRSRSPFSCSPLALIFHTHGKSSLSFFVGQILQERQNFVPFSKDLFIFRFSENMALKWGTLNCGAMYCTFSGKSNKSLSVADRSSKHLPVCTYLIDIAKNKCMY